VVSTSTAPTATHYLDDWEGVARLYTLDGGVKKIVSPNVGKVDYAKGLVSIDSQIITSTTPITFTVNPASPDVFSVRNTILVIAKEDIAVSVIAEAPDVNDHISTLRT
jgi:hypothetical protein